MNLPRNQKTVLRVSPQASLAEIFKQVVSDKNLDPYKHELRHSTQPDVALNMASPLGMYQLTEISLVNIAGRLNDITLVNIAGRLNDITLVNIASRSTEITLVNSR